MYLKEAIKLHERRDCSPALIGGLVRFGAAADRPGSVVIGSEYSSLTR